LRAVWRDEQVRGCVGLLAAFSLLLAIWLSATRDVSFLAALRMAAFNVTSIVTTTGFASTDYTLWGPFAVGKFFVLTFVGGCTGSTAGESNVPLADGGQLTRGYLRNLISPHRVLRLTFTAAGCPRMWPSPSSLSSAYTGHCRSRDGRPDGHESRFRHLPDCGGDGIGNVGRALARSSAGRQFSTLPPAAKWVLSITMMLGRLELFTVLVLFRPEFWR